MASFQYRAYDAGGRLVSGQLESATREAALDALRRQGALPVEIAATDATESRSRYGLSLLRRGTLPDATLALVTRELATLLDADLPLDDALRLIALQPSLDARARRSVDGVLQRVLAGTSLSEALASEAHAFPEVFARLVAAGEQSGGLARPLAALASDLERRVALRTTLRDALIYPLVLLAAAVVALSVVVGVLVPAIAPLFDEAGVAAPPVIAVLRDLQTLVATRWPLLVAAVVALVLLLALAGERAGIRRGVDALILRLPIAGPLVQRRETARLAATLATLLGNGVAMLDAMRIAGTAQTNHVYRAATAGMTERLASGSMLSGEIAASGLYAELAQRMIAIGERTGDLPGMLARLARIEEAALQRGLERIAGLVAPLLTITIGLFVGAIILSVMDAVLGLNELALR